MINIQVVLVIGDINQTIVGIHDECVPPSCLCYQTAQAPGKTASQNLPQFKFMHIAFTASVVDLQGPLTALGTEEEGV